MFRTKLEVPSGTFRNQSLASGTFRNQALASGTSRNQIRTGFDDWPELLNILAFLSLCLEQILLMKARTIFSWSSFSGSFWRGMNFSKKATIDHRSISGTGLFSPEIYRIRKEANLLQSNFRPILT